MFGWNKNKKKEPASASPLNQPPPQPGVRMKWYSPPQAHLHTVIFVHGILGHYVKTWGDFPKLLSEDEDLPQLDILLWGFRTGLFARHHELRMEGGHLATTLETLIRQKNDVFLVGHSMGGLIILKALVDRMEMGDAQAHPCCAITWISLFATPLNGVWLAGLARGIVAWPLRFFDTMHKHLHDLSKGDFVRELLREVRERIYSPEAENAERRKIPIRIIAATFDSAVDQQDRDFELTPYNNPRAHQLDYTHTEVKLPSSRADLRYKVLAEDLQKAISGPFQQLCSRIVDPAATPDDREVALEDMRVRYAKLIGSRFRDVAVPADQRETAESELLQLVSDYGAVHREPPFSVINRAITVLKARHRDWR